GFTPPSSSPNVRKTEGPTGSSARAPAVVHAASRTSTSTRAAVRALRGRTFQELKGCGHSSAPCYTAPMKLFAAALLLAPLVAAGEGGNVPNPSVVIKTSIGDITVELAADKAPETVKNFLQYVDDKFYDKTIFHRVIAGFMIQGGGLDAGLVKKAT